MNSFFAMLSRMKYINRWGLMRNTRNENISEHSGETAVIAHALALLRNTRFGGNVDPGRVALLALYHDAPEILTGDLPTPVKYHSPQIRQAYAEVEQLAISRLLALLPPDLQPHYKDLLCFSATRDEEYEILVKAADKISALIKCIEEKKSGNKEFAQAEKSLRKAVDGFGLPEVQVFLSQMLPAYSLTLDEQEKED